MNSGNGDTPTRSEESASLAILDDAPVLMLRPERILLYGLVRALRPRRILEIGTHRGGSAMIITAALDEVGAGALFCVDPEPMVAPEHQRRIAHRSTLFPGASPEILVEARAAADGPFDFVFIDGDHSRAGVLRDVEGVLPLIADGAYVLFHDAHFPEVAAAIDGELAAHPARLVDCGMLSVDRSIDEHGNVWGGLRLLRHRARSPAVAEAAGRAPVVSAFAAVIAETAGLSRRAAQRAARGLLNRQSYQADYVAGVRALWKQNDEAFVRGLYRLLLAREGEAEGVRTFVRGLVDGASRLELVRAFVFSSEAKARGVPSDWLGNLTAVLDVRIAQHDAVPPRRPWLARLIRHPGRLGKAARLALRALYLPVNAEKASQIGATQLRELARQGEEIRALHDAFDEVAERVEALATRAEIERR